VTLTDAIGFVKDAAERSMPGGVPALYVFHGGFVHARSAAVVAAHPVDLDGTFALPADDLDAALARLGDDPIIDAGDGTMILKKGRLRSQLKVLEAEVPVVFAAPEWQGVPPTLMKALELVAPFASDEGTWQRGVHLADGRAAAINNRSAAESPVADLPDMDAILGDGAARYLPTLPEPSGWAVAANSISFGWPNGAWVRCQLVNASWPAIADRVMVSAGDEAPITLTEEWREAIDHLSALGDGAIRVMPQGLKAARSHSDAKVKFDTSATKSTTWAADLLKQIAGVATAWNPDAEGPARFIGEGLRGVVMRRRG